MNGSNEKKGSAVDIATFFGLSPAARPITNFSLFRENKLVLCVNRLMHAVEDVHFLLDIYIVWDYAWILLVYVGALISAFDSIAEIEYVLEETYCIRV